MDLFALQEIDSPSALTSAVSQRNRENTQHKLVSLRPFADGWFRRCIHSSDLHSVSTRMEITVGWPWRVLLITLINPSLPINLLAPLPVWRQMWRTEANLFRRKRPDVGRIQTVFEQQPLTYTGRWLHIDFYCGIHYKTDGVIFFLLN